MTRLKSETLDELAILVKDSVNEANETKSYLPLLNALSKLNEKKKESLEHAGNFVKHYNLTALTEGYVSHKQITIIDSESAIYDLVTIRTNELSNEVIDSLDSIEGTISENHKHFKNDNQDFFFSKDQHYVGIK